jgi:hypothetical protein
MNPSGSFGGTSDAVPRSCIPLCRSFGVTAGVSFGVSGVGESALIARKETRKIGGFFCPNEVRTDFQSFALPTELPAHRRDVTRGVRPRTRTSIATDLPHRLQPGIVQAEEETSECRSSCEAVRTRRCRVSASRPPLWTRRNRSPSLPGLRRRGDRSPARPSGSSRSPRSGSRR